LTTLEVEIKQMLLEVLIMKFPEDTKGAKIIKGPEDKDKNAISSRLFV
jgi:hypothetical protein